MLKIYVGKDESFDDAYRRFKRLVNKSGILLECKKREFFMNNHDKRIFKQKNKAKKK